MYKRWCGSRPSESPSKSKSKRFAHVSISMHFPPLNYFYVCISFPFPRCMHFLSFPSTTHHPTRFHCRSGKSRRSSRPSAAISSAVRGRRSASRSKCFFRWTASSSSYT